MNELIATLRGSLAHDAVIAGDAIDLRYLGDWLLHDAAVRPAALVRPSSTAEVSDVVRVCNARRALVAAKGGRTGLARGAVPRG